MTLAPYMTVSFHVLPTRHPQSLEKTLPTTYSTFETIITQCANDHQTTTSWSYTIHGTSPCRATSQQEIEKLLEEKGSRVFARMNKAELRRQLDRALRDLLCYGQCTKDELIRFIVDRGLEFKGAHTRRELITVLEEADEILEFGQIS